MSLSGFQERHVEDPEKTERPMNTAKDPPTTFQNLESDIKLTTAISVKQQAMLVIILYVHCVDCIEPVFGDEGACSVRS
jgi:hypothetical protein